MVRLLTALQLKAVQVNGDVPVILVKEPRIPLI